MAPKDRLTPYACIGLALVSFALLSAIVAEPVLRLVWTPQVTIAHNGAGGSR
jgi:hypothetical protein